VLINIRHARDLNYCVRGCKTFCEKHNIDFKAFVKNGVPEEEFLRTGDGMAIKMVEKAKEDK